MSQGLIAAPIHNAAGDGDIDGVQRLLDCGTDVNAVCDIGGTPLHWSSFFGHKNMVEMLIRNEAEVNAVDKWNNTPLYLAAFKGHIEIVQLLINNLWCDHTIVNKNGNTPEYIARSEGHTEIADMLHNAPTVMQKVFNSGYGLQLLAARVANKKEVYEEDYNKFPYMVRNLITNIRKDNKPSYLNEDAGSSGYHSDDVSSIATEDLEEILYYDSI